MNLLDFSPEIHSLIISKLDVGSMLNLRKTCVLMKKVIDGISVSLDLARCCSSELPIMQKYIFSKPLSSAQVSFALTIYKNTMIEALDPFLVANQILECEANNYKIYNYTTTELKHYYDMICKPFIHEINDREIIDVYTSSLYNNSMFLGIYKKEVIRRGLIPKDEINSLDISKVTKRKFSEFRIIIEERPKRRRVTNIDKSYVSYCSRIVRLFCDYDPNNQASLSKVKGEIIEAKDLHDIIVDQLLCKPSVYLMFTHDQLIRSILNMLNYMLSNWIKKYHDEIVSICEIFSKISEYMSKDYIHDLYIKAVKCGTFNYAHFIEVTHLKYYDRIKLSNEELELIIINTIKYKAEYGIDLLFNKGYYIKNLDLNPFKDLKILKLLAHCSTSKISKLSCFIKGNNIDIFLSYLISNEVGRISDPIYINKLFYVIRSHTFDSRIIHAFINANKCDKLYVILEIWDKLLKPHTDIIMGIIKTPILLDGFLKRIINKHTIIDQNSIDTIFQLLILSNDYIKIIKIYEMITNADKKYVYLPKKVTNNEFMYIKVLYMKRIISKIELNTIVRKNRTIFANDYDIKWLRREMMYDLSNNNKDGSTKKSVVKNLDSLEDMIY